METTCRHSSIFAVASYSDRSDPSAEFTDRNACGSNPTSASRLLLSWDGQPASISALLLPSCGMSARHPKGATVERFQIKLSSICHLLNLKSSRRCQFFSAYQGAQARLISITVGDDSKHPQIFRNTSPAKVFGEERKELTALEGRLYSPSRDAQERTRRVGEDEESHASGDLLDAFSVRFGA
ncbi:hypothetical protein T265_01283 [Opisthorchis viverrini]|uniref:Uncharacterized protein n=1 Tax=Opisthorchis viverrini TaxID=6198 RepID=A0A075A2W7_OPIVI|nr:hypothetical protein T265_01283 [Opisthorchis viverrini]KER32592.1 hypothetical protein T265_01283 [Opisthorchis viverrini]